MENSYFARNCKRKHGLALYLVNNEREARYPLVAMCATRAAVRYTIETVLDELPRRYTPDLYQKKCDVVYQHIFDSYYGQGSLWASN